MSEKRRGWCAIAKDHAIRDEEQRTSCDCVHCRRECNCPADSLPPAQRA